MKYINYFIQCFNQEYNPDTGKIEPRECLVEIHGLPASEENIARAQMEAYNGDYSIFDDGNPEPEMTDKERIAELEEALALLLSGGTE